MIFRWLWSPLGGWIEHRLWRWGPYKRLTSRLVWAELERSHPDFLARIEASRQEAIEKGLIE